jgi:hypothetical protein
MKTRILVAAAVGVFFWSGADAESYYVRNRPFTQVIKAGGEAMVGVEAFLRAAGYNWTTEGNVVTLTEKPAANPPLAAGNWTFRNGTNEAVLESSQRGGSAYAPLSSLAKLLQYSVNVNRASGTVDVVKARFSTDDEKKMVGQVMEETAAQKKAVQEAWAKKAAELKEKREAASKAAEGEGSEGEEKSGEGEEGKKSEDGKKSEGKEPKDGKKPKEEKTPPAETPPASGDAKPPADKDEKKEAPKSAALEVTQNNCTPDYGNGTVTMNLEVKNLGDAASKPISGTVILTGPDNSGSATVSNQGRTKVIYTKSVSGPSIQPGASWPFSQKYSFPGGNSLPAGNYSVQFKLNSTK